MKKTYLYVILLPQMNEKRELGYMVKFGYTENFENRMKMGYNQYHGYVEVLHLYEGNFTMDDETRIKHYFREKDCVFVRDEYLKFIPEVLDFFDIYNTTEKLKRKISQLPKMSKNGRSYYEVDDLYIECILHQCYSDFQLTDKQNMIVKIYKKLRNYSPEEQIVYIQSTYNISKEVLQKYIEDNSVDMSKVSKKVKELLKKFNSYVHTKRKLAYLVKVSEMGLSKEDFTNFLHLIPTKFREYYIVMGPDRIRANSCQESKLKAEWDRVHQEEIKASKELINDILGFFKLGYRFSRAKIKEKLKELYQKHGYKKTAKAPNLKEYFWLKDVKILKDGKWVNGYEITGKK